MSSFWDIVYAAVSVVLGLGLIVLGLGLIVGVTITPGATLFTVWAGAAGGWMLGWHSVSLYCLLRETK